MVHPFFLWKLRDLNAATEYIIPRSECLGEERIQSALNSGDDMQHGQMYCFRLTAGMKTEINNGTYSGKSKNDEMYYPHNYYILFIHPIGDSGSC